MNNTLKQIKSTGLPEVKADTAQNIVEFFEKIIKPQFEKKEAIKAIHKALLEYIERPDAVFVLRLYGSDSKKNYNNLRRGFLTVFPIGKRLVFCDNTFAMPFAAMKICGKTYTPEALSKYMNDPTTRFGFGSTKEERELAFYNWSGNGLNINLNLQGWYLAHIVPVGKNYAGDNLSMLFNNPKRQDWLVNTDHIRHPKQDLTTQEETILKAHFLRMIHPLNSFMVPKQTLLAYDGKNIGEEPELINIVTDYLSKEFPEEYNEFCEIIMKPEDPLNIASPIGKIVWGTSQSMIKKEKSKIKSVRKKELHRSQSVKCKEILDVYEDNAEDRLENTLRSIGKEAFVKLYPLLKGNINIDAAGVSKVYPEYNQYSVTSQRTRLSSSRGIFNRGLEREALENIANSPHIKKTVKQEALKFLSKL